MAKQGSLLKTVPPSAIAAVAVALFGYMYSFSFGGLLEAQHWYLFSSSQALVIEEFNTSVAFLSITMFIYYTLFIVAAVMMYLRSRKYVAVTLLLMAGTRLLTLLLMFRPGLSMVFQYGFEMILEIVAILCIVYIYKNAKKNKKLFDSRITVCVLAVLAECIPLLRNFQFLFIPELTLGAKLSAVLLPCFTSLFLCLVALRSAAIKKRVPVTVAQKTLEPENMPALPQKEEKTPENVPVTENKQDVKD